MIRAALVLVTAAAIACATSATGGGGRDNFITREEIAASQITNVYDMIKNLRPAFLRSRGQTTFEPGIVQTAVIFVDGQKYGEIDTLRNLSVAEATSVRFLTPSEATNKYGTGYTAGIIEVSTR